MRRFWQYSRRVSDQRPPCWIQLCANFEVLVNFELVRFLHGGEDESQVGAKRLHTVKRGDKWEWQVAFAVHLATQKEIAIQILLAEVIFTAKRVNRMREITAQIIEGQLTFAF